MVECDIDSMFTVFMVMCLVGWYNIVTDYECEVLHMTVIIYELHMHD